jgi:hypothetical protein
MKILQMLEFVNLFSLIVGKTSNFKKKILVRIYKLKKKQIWLHYFNYGTNLQCIKFHENILDVYFWPWPCSFLVSFSQVKSTQLECTHIEKKKHKQIQINWPPKINLDCDWLTQQVARSLTHKHKIFYWQCIPSKNKPKQTWQWTSNKHTMSLVDSSPKKD